MEVRRLGFARRCSPDDSRWDVKVIEIALQDVFLEVADQGVDTVPKWSRREESHDTRENLHRTANAQLTLPADRLILHEPSQLAHARETQMRQLTQFVEHPPPVGPLDGEQRAVARAKCRATRSNRAGFQHAVTQDLAGCR